MRPESIATETTAATFLVRDIEFRMRQLRDRGVSFLEYDRPGLRTIDGVYSDDPRKNPAAERFEQISHDEVLARAERAITQMVLAGCKLIFTTSFGYMDPTINVAKDFPDTVFIHISGFKTADNVGTGFGKIEEPRYVSGQIAGAMSDSTARTAFSVRS